MRFAFGTRSGRPADVWSPWAGSAMMSAGRRPLVLQLPVSAAPQPPVSDDPQPAPESAPQPPDCCPGAPDGVPTAGPPLP